MRVRIKFCGITSVADAAAAVAAGADALGFVFYPPSPRYVTPALAAEIVAGLPPFVTAVGLFVNATPEEVRSIVAETAVSVVQFHGDESPAACRGAPCRWIKAIRVAPDTDIEAAAAPYAEASAVLLDTYDAALYGGSGRTFDWAQLPAQLARPFVLAGGLTPDNVAEAVRRTRPYAVDVSGGIERAKGRKDPHKMRRFVTEVNQVECQT
ncbi:MAG: phosphoribosylanthranilate isomerase [Gammaproteobacteria bacterium]|nr:phosphoribosylanthranilate isomerase [Gammaproteobacteria bacterium]